MEYLASGCLLNHLETFYRRKGIGTFAHSCSSILLPNHPVTPRFMILQVASFFSLSGPSLSAVEVQSGSRNYNIVKDSSSSISVCNGGLRAFYSDIKENKQFFQGQDGFQYLSPAPSELMRLPILASGFPTNGLVKKPKANISL